MVSFEDTAREYNQAHAIYQFLLELDEKVYYPNEKLSYTERMETLLLIDMTIGSWIQLLHKYKELSK